MCMIVIKEKGISLPSTSQYKSYINDNLGGIGYMYHRDGGSFVYIKKGFMTLEDLYKSLSDNNVTTNDTVVFHFHNGTVGKTEPKNTHPFPLSKQVNRLFSLDIKTSVGVAHEGILSEYGNKKLTDTQDFIIRVLSDPNIYRNINNITIKKLISGALDFGNKLAFLDKNGNIIRIGTWREKDKLWFSNHEYQYQYEYNSNAWVHTSRDLSSDVDWWESQTTLTRITWKNNEWFLCPKCNEYVPVEKKSYLQHCLSCGAVFGRHGQITKVNKEECSNYYGKKFGESSNLNNLIRKNEINVVKFNFLGLEWCSCPICKSRVAVRDSIKLYYCKKCYAIFGNHIYFRSNKKDVKKHYRIYYKDYKAYSNPEYYNKIKNYYELKRKGVIPNETSK